MLTLETGEGLSNSNSLVDLAYLRAFAGSRGHQLPAEDATLEQKLLLAHDYLLAIEPRLQGVRAVIGQALPFPRRGVTIYGSEVAQNTVPLSVKNALCQLVVESLTTDLLPRADGKVVIAETVGPISTTYANPGTTGNRPFFPRVEAFLLPFLNISATQLRAVRV